MSHERVRVVVADWTACRGDAGPVRHEVFVLEQHVPEALELDDLDGACVHAIAYDEAGNAIGTGRLLPDGHIGRMAVRRAWRGRGVGAQLLSALMEAARRRGDREVVLSAQLSAREFYARYGFRAEGPTYMDAGIEHIAMRRALSAATLEPDQSRDAVGPT